ncbi:IS66 family insertion sequence element accessory protein TnpB (plasmid) [Cupriavidus basilensis]|uniref:IS66 family insertion sequence element accessory protein TnpB n=2 Tax=Cupriavidus basilensis TaxID=68895 RepID=A0A643FZ06_9BURK|nr:IS66 family insertion sequence element accessory protein TnpB [Cupriavidus basilensis]
MTVLEQIRQEDASVAGVALSHGVDPNMVHRWMREDRQRQMPATLQNGGAFVPLQVLPSPAAGQLADADRCETPAPATPEVIHIEIQRAAGTLIVPERSQWPRSRHFRRGLATLTCFRMG